MENVKETFLVEDEKGKELVATVITRIKVEDTDLEYLIYSIDDEKDTRNVPENDKHVIIMAAKVNKDENGDEYLTNIEDEEEKKAIYDAFTESYNKAMTK